MEKLITVAARSHLRVTEADLAPTFGYMEGHSAVHQPLHFIDHNIRSIVVAWLVELSVEPGLHQETVFLAISLLDRFLSLTKVRLIASARPIEAPARCVHARHACQLPT